MSERIKSLELRTSEIMEIGGTALALVSASFVGKIGGAEEVAMFSGIFVFVAAGRDVVCRTVGTVIDVAQQRRAGRSGNKVDPDGLEPSTFTLCLPFADGKSDISENVR